MLTISSIGIQAVVAESNGTISVQINGSPSGSVEVWACAAGEIVAPRFALPTSAIAGRAGWYSVTAPSAGIWYLWAKDALGFSASPHAVCQEDARINQLKTWLHGLLVTNKTGIEASMQRNTPGCTLKHILQDITVDAIDYPTIVVQKPSFSFQWYQLGFGQLWTYTFQILCTAHRADEQSALSLSAAMADAVVHVLTRRDLLNPLIGGIRYFNATASGAQGEDYAVETGWVSIYTAQYSLQSDVQIGASVPG